MQKRRPFSHWNRTRIGVILGFSIGVLLLLVAVMIWVIPPAFEVGTYSMEAYVQQSVYGRNGEKAAEEAANRIAELENQISWKRAGSEVERLNLYAGQNFIAVDSRVSALLKLSQEVSEKTWGAFDVTIAPLSRLWDFGGENPAVPEDSLIQKVKQDVNYKDILWEGGPENATAKVALKNKTTALDLDLIAKGAACDEAIEVYRQNGIKKAVVSVGKTVGVLGKRFLGLPWGIALKDPVKDEGLGILNLTEGFLSTADSTEKAFESNGKRYHHLLDVHTGYPAESGLLSVTVQAESGALSDALATACFVLGYEKSLPVLAEYQAEAVFLTTDRTVIITKGLNDSFKLTGEDYHLTTESN